MTNFTTHSRKFLTATALSLCLSQAQAQGESAALLRAGTEDANKLFNAYLSPALTAFGVGMNGGWFNTAKPHGLGGFDITISANAPFAPSNFQSFDVNALGLKNTVVIPSPSGSSGVSPTIFGDATPGSQVAISAPNPAYGYPGQPQTINIDTFELPQGMGVNFVPVPTTQLAVGVGFGTEVAVRFVPDLNFGGFGIGLFGFAVKHDIKQWIPVVKEMPFDMSAMFGYTSMKTGISFTGESQLTPESGSDIYDPNPNKNYTGQKAEFNSKSWTANLLISKKLGPLTPYLGLGYQNSTTDLNLSGDYPITFVNDAYDPTAAPGTPQSKTKKIEVLTDPIKLSGGSSSFRTTVGLRLKLAILTIHGDYTFAEYNMASAGIGLNLQSIVPFKM